MKLSLLPLLAPFAFASRTFVAPRRSLAGEGRRGRVAELPERKRRHAVARNERGRRGKGKKGGRERKEEEIR